jgi:hypothetical protein
MKLGAISLALLALALGGCPRRSTNSNRAPEACKQFGQQCQLEPGKLGSCSYRANCSGPSCLYCQSQH